MNESTRSLIDVERLASAVREQSTRFEQRPSDAIVRPWVEAALEQDVLGVSSFVQYGSSHEFRSDEAVDRGGQESAPSPMRYMLSGVAFCFQGWCAKTFAVHGHRLTSLRLGVRTMLDIRGELLLADVPAHPQWIVLDATVESLVPAGEVLAHLQEAKRRCPLTALLAQAVPVHLRATLNGLPLIDERPDALRTEHLQEMTR